MRYEVSHDTGYTCALLLGQYIGVDTCEMIAVLGFVYMVFYAIGYDAFWLGR